MSDFTTLAEAVANIGKLYPENGFTFQDQDGHETTYTFPAIVRETARRAAALRRLGVAAGDHVALVAADPKHFALTFLAAIRLGAVPIPIYPPLYLARLDSYFQHTASILSSSRAKLVVVSVQWRDKLEALSRQIGAAVRVADVESLGNGDDSFEPPDRSISPDDVAFLQYTSGSTAEPRGVIVTHRSLISNVRAFVAGLDAHAARDKGVSWLPLYHDMGLIGFVLAPIYAGISIVFIPTLRFVRNPNVWMETIHAHRGTITFAPNFAFDLALRKACAAKVEHWDLSCLRALGCGAEPIQPETMRTFADVFGNRWRLSRASLVPAYGLAESTLATTMKPLQDPLGVRRVDRAAFEREGRAVEADVHASDVLEHVSCGVPFPGHELTIRSASGRLLRERCEGEICLRGPSIGRGYVGVRGGWGSAMRDGWLRTGDLGYLHAGELYVTGRIKDVIILNGRNIHPQQIEWIVSDLESVRRGCVVAFSRPSRAGEELVVVVEARRNGSAAITEIEDTIQRAMLVTPADVVFLKPGSLPRTSSGKLRRHQIRKSYLNGSLSRKEQARTSACAANTRMLRG
jgi:fatty-acyl-CoA synthase